MSRRYTELECGCLISCDGAGGLMQVCGHYDEQEGIWIEDNNCKVKEYMKKHDMKFGWCPICHPIQYREAVEEYKNHGDTNKYYK